MFSLFRKRPPLILKGLFDIPTGVLLVSGNNFQVINLLKEFILDSEIRFFKSPSVGIFRSGDDFPAVNIFLRWDNKESRYMQAEHVSDTLKNVRVIARAKYCVLEKILNAIHSFRLNFKKNILFQELIYQAKKEQSLRFRECAYNEASIYDYPYILQYADLRGITFREAADEIIIKAEMESSLLEKSELMRLRYLTAVKNAKDVAETEAVYEKFLLDFDLHI